MIAREDASEAESGAARWDARLRSYDCSAEERRQFQAWLSADIGNAQAFQRLQAALATLRVAAHHPELRALRETARMSEQRSGYRRRAARIGIAAAIVIVVISLGYVARPSSQVHEAAVSSGMSSATSLLQGDAWITAPRERRTVALPDGSIATLNASTRIEAEWLPHERRIHLIAGRALFRVAKDRKRPFIVTAGDRSVTALGTVFDVSLEADKVQVTLLEGRVAVRGVGHAAGQPILELEPSQQLVAVDGARPTVHTVNATTVSAWSDGQVFFTDEALPAAVAEMNQYSAKEIVAGPELSQIRVNGMFRAGNQDGFVNALMSYFPLDAHTDERGRIVLTHRSGGRPTD